MKYQKIFGFKVFSGGYNSLINIVKKDIENDQQKTIAAINPEKIVNCRKKPTIQKTLKSFDYLIPDGSGVVWAINRKNEQQVERITGIDLMKKLCQLANDNRYKVFFYGANKKTGELMIDKIEKDYPNLKVVGYQDGYQSNNDDILSAINKVKPNILFVALGSPKQEEWIQHNKQGLKANIVQGVGGSFDVISGNIKRAPLWMQKIGLEWLYRLIKQPKRIFRSYKLLFYVINVMTGEYEQK